MRGWRLLAVITAILALAGCSSVDVEQYAGNQPALVPEQFFNGQLSAHGVVKDRGGKVLRYFNATIDASWQDGVGTLDERFLFDDGEEQTRVWTLRPNGDGRYIGTAGDVVGEADVRVAGNAMHLEYVLEVPYGDGTINLTMDDWMHLVDAKTIINQTKMKKWGFRVGEVVLTIRKLD